MSISKKAFGLALSLLAVSGINSANAQSAAEKEDAVLFKIHDIVPIRNLDGDVIGCDFNTTFYNRSSYTIKGAEVEMGWKDDSLGKVIDTEKKEDMKKNRRSASRAYSETERVSTLDVNTTVEVSSLKPRKQVTITSRIDTDRCFLLINPVMSNIKSCSIEGIQERKGRRSDGQQDGCSRMFQFVSAEDPQYYLEFEEISLDEQKAQREATKKEGKSEIDVIYKRATDSLNGASNALSSIK
jgi:hypothetical protein